MSEILLAIIFLCIFIFVGLWLAFTNVHKYIVYSVIVIVMTVIATAFLHLYDTRLGYPVNKPIPEKFRFVYYVAVNEIHYVWLIKKGEKEPRVYILDAAKFKQIEKKLAQANQNVREGLAVEGEVKPREIKGNSDTVVTDKDVMNFKIVKPDTLQK